MTIQILGSGCPNCRRLEQNAREVVAELGLPADFEKVTDHDRILDMGVLRTPGLAIDGEVRLSGRVASSAEIREVLVAAAGAPPEA